MEHSVLNALISVVVVVIVIAVIFIFFLIVLVIEPETDVLVESYIEVVRGTTSNRYWYPVAVVGFGEGRSLLSNPIRDKDQP